MGKIGNVIGKVVKAAKGLGAKAISTTRSGLGKTGDYAASRLSGWKNTKNYTSAGSPFGRVKGTPAHAIRMTGTTGKTAIRGVRSFMGKHLFASAAIAGTAAEIPGMVKYFKNKKKNAFKSYLNKGGR